MSTRGWLENSNVADMYKFNIYLIVYHILNYNIRPANLNDEEATMLMCD